MFQHEIPQSAEDWLGLTKLAAVLAGRQATGATRNGASADCEVIDRLYRTLEILTLVEQNADMLRAHASGSTEHDAMTLAVELRRLANRLQSIGDFLSSAGDGALELENQLVSELDGRYRAQSVRHHAA